MIPELGMIVCAYTIWRIIETLMIGRQRYSSGTGHTIAVLCGIGAIVVIGFLGMGLLLTSASSSLPSGR